MSPFLEHLSVPKGCQQAMAFGPPSKAGEGPRFGHQACASPPVRLDRPYEENLVPAAVFRAAARSLVLLVLATPAERRETILSEALTSPWPALRKKGDPRNKPSAVEPGMPQRRLSCGLGNGSRFNDDATFWDCPGPELARGPHGWRGGGPARCGGLTFITERVKKRFSGKKRGDFLP